MANVSGFNHDLDKITERELVYDIYSRIKSGKDLKIKNEVYFENTLDPSILSNATENNGTFSNIFSKKTNIKDIDSKILTTIDTPILSALKDNNYKIAVIRIGVPMASHTDKYNFYEQYDGHILFHATNGVYIGNSINDVSHINNDNYKVVWNNDPKSIKIRVFNNSSINHIVICKAYFESNHIDIKNILKESLYYGNIYVITLDLDNIDFTNDDYLKIFYY